MYLQYSRNLKQNARLLRQNMTNPERFLWSKIRSKQVRGLQWYRQKPIANYIVDFYCPKAKLVIEIDGDQHYEETMRVKDEERDNALQSLGVCVLRFGNNDIFQNVEGVLMSIQRAIDKSLPTSLFQREE
ncbi:MAG: glycyl-tRNA synthetase subunit alpha [Parcubacteria group bacterium Gr01-1014_29]|nr:MAG: glycyl-tRNA synthetase subunit alpha [Parcubacteria group bacterium Gr01-1014_29]